MIAPAVRQGAPPAEAGARPGVATVVAGAGIAGLPLLTPTGPGNTGPIDLLLLGAVVVTLGGLLRLRRELELPYVRCVYLLVVAGAVAGVAGGVLAGSVLVLVQDLVLLAWAVALANVGREGERLRWLLKTWAWSSIVWATILVVAVTLGLDGLAGVDAEEGARASLTFGDPNRAGSYFALSLLVVVGCGVPGGRATRFAAGVVLLLAVAHTGSNAALAGLLVGGALALVVTLLRRAGTAGLALVACSAAGAVWAATGSVDVSAVTWWAKDSGSVLLENTVGRAGESGDDRSLLLSENLALLRHEDVFGLGPGNTKATLADRQAQYVKEAHNDYLAALVERGPLGGLALAALMGSVGIKAASLLRVRPSPLLLAAVPRPELLGAAAASVAVMAWFHEVLHFRHVWALLGLVAAAAVVATDSSIKGRRQ